jgi:transcription elongation factor GreA
MAEIKKNILTQEGLRKLEAELEELKVVRRKEVAQKIKEAREQGDLSENAEYDAAKDEQRDIETRIEQLEEILRHAEVVEVDETEVGKVSIGCSIRLYDEEFEEEVTYKLVGSTEANILQNKISNESPIGLALLGKSAGDVAVVEGLEGTCTFKILEVIRD